MTQRLYYGEFLRVRKKKRSYEQIISITYGNNKNKMFYYSLINILLVYMYLKSSWRYNKYFGYEQYNSYIINNYIAFWCSK